jgi:ceramide glucosyltransferase
MRVMPEYLRRVTAPLADPAVGLVTCPYRGYGARGLASRLEALGIGTDFIPSAFVAYYLAGVRFAFGSTIVVRREALDQIGGFEALADELADDYRLAELVRGAGWEVRLSDYVVDDVLARESFGEMWSRRLRWARTARAMRPGPYAGAFITHGVPLALLFAASTGFAPVGWLTLCVVATIRCTTAIWIACRCTRDPVLPRLLLLLPVSDLLNFTLWACSHFGHTVVWRGERLRLGPGGRLKER